MSEQRAIYHYEGEDNQPQEKAQPVSLTLNSEQVRGIIHCTAQKSPAWLLRTALAAINDDQAAEIIAAIFIERPALAQRMNIMDNVQGS